jgi:hypothetical protein
VRAHMDRGRVGKKVVGICIINHFCKFLFYTRRHIYFPTSLHPRRLVRFFYLHSLHFGFSFGFGVFRWKRGGYGTRNGSGSGN